MARHRAEPERGAREEVLRRDEHERARVAERPEQAADEPHVVVERQPRDERVARDRAHRGDERVRLRLRARACVSATGFGSTVEPDENCTSASASGARRASAAAPAESSAASSQPSAGAPRATAGPSSRRTAPLGDDERARRRPRACAPCAATYSSIRPSRTGG